MQVEIELKKKLGISPTNKGNFQMTGIQKTIGVFEYDTHPCSSGVRQIALFIGN